MRINKSLITLTSSDASVAWSNITGTPTTLSGYGITDGVPTSRTLTINGVSYDLSANRTWTISTGTVTSVALATGTSGSDVNVSGSPITSSGTITLNIPDASATARGLVTTGTQTISGSKTFSGIAFFQNTLNCSGQLASTGGFGVSIVEAVSITTPSAGRGTLFAKTDKKVYWKNSDGTEYDLTANSGTPAGSNTQVQFNNSGAFGADSNFVWDNSNKRIGIGIASPTEKLTIEGGVGYLFTAQENSANKVKLQMYVDTNEASIVSQYVTTAKPLCFYTSGVKQITLSTSGNLLLNSTTDTGDKLQITGSAIATGNITANNRTRLGSGWISDISVSGNDTGISFGANTILPTNGSGSYTVKDLGTSSNQWGAAYLSSRSFINGAAGYLFDVQENGSNKTRLQVYVDTAEVALISSYDTTAKPMTFYSGGSKRVEYKTTGQIQLNNYQSSTSFTGTPIANLQVDSSGNVITTGITTSGTYTPTLTNVANISSSIPDLCTYTRIGTIVAVQGFLTLTPTSGSLTTTIGISLPIASNFNAGTDASGIYVSTSNDRFGGINPDQTNDRVEISFTSSSNGTRNFYFSFQYQIK